MKNMWPQSFKENSNPAPKEILETQARLLAKLTNNRVFAEVVEESISKVSIFEGITGEFCFRLDIVGQYIAGGYRFRVLTFCHDISLYPVKFRLDSELGRELKGKDVAEVTIETPEALEVLLESVLKSDRVQNVVGAILKLSK